MGKRQKTVSLRLSDEEIAELQAESDRTGEQMSVLLRRRALAVVPPGGAAAGKPADRGGPDPSIVVYHVDQLGSDPLRMPGGGSLAR